MPNDETRRAILARRQRLVAAAIAGLGATGAAACSHGHPQPCLEPPPIESDPATPVPSTETTAERDTNRDEPPGEPPAETQTLVGPADNAKAGAVVLVDDVPYYVDGLRAWPDALRGKRVEVTGRVVTRQGLEPIPASEPQAAGIVGPYQLVESATWRLAP